MPIALVRRLIGAVKWPVEIVRQGKHFGTRQAKDCGAAGDLHGLVTQIRNGGLASDQQTSAA